MAMTAGERVKKQREKFRAYGYKEVRVWVPNDEDAASLQLMARMQRNIDANENKLEVCVTAYAVELATNTEKAVSVFLFTMYPRKQYGDMHQRRLDEFIKNTRLPVYLNETHAAKFVVSQQPSEVERQMRWAADDDYVQLHGAFDMASFFAYVDYDAKLGKFGDAIKIRTT